MTYSIKAVDVLNNEEAAHDIKELHKLTFADTAPLPDLENAPIQWWLVYADNVAVSFAGMQRAVRHFNAGYLVRSGVIHDHRGNGLQRRLLRVRETAARKRGWETLVTDTTGSVASSNNLIAAGYRIYEPEWPWAFTNTIYWRKKLSPRGSR